MSHANEFRVETGWRTLFKDLGVRPRDVLRRARLPEDLFARADARVSTSQYFALWEALREEIGDPRFPLLLAEGYAAEGFSPPLFAALCSPNLAVALDRLGRYKRLIAPMRLAVDRTDAGLTARFEWINAATAPPPTLVVSEVAFLVKLARMATREPVVPLKVTALEPPEPAAPYTEYLGVPIRRGGSHAVTFSPVDADRPFLTANDRMWSVFEPELRRRLAELDANASVRERVRAVLLESLPSGQTSMDDVASRLGMSRRTLQRRLKGEGSSYQRQLAETREQLARHYLAKTALTCSEISFLLGYEEPNSFFRAFQEWTGDSPEQLRQQLRH